VGRNIKRTCCVSCPLGASRGGDGEAAGGEVETVGGLGLEGGCHQDEDGDEDGEETEQKRFHRLMSTVLAGLDALGEFAPSSRLAHLDFHPGAVEV